MASSSPAHVCVALLGFGSANQELAKLLLKKAERLHAERKLKIIVTGIFTRRHGGIIDLGTENGIDLGTALQEAEDLSRAGGSECYGKSRETGTDDILEYLEKLRAGSRLHILAEGIIANYQDGEPAATFARYALSKGIHYCTANKAPVALFYEELTNLAQQEPQCKFRFESACGDGVPLFNLTRYCTPSCKVVKFAGINNTTTNLILEKMETQGFTVDEGIKVAQDLGIAEADPSGDVDGWDAAVKCLCLARAMMQGEMPANIDAIPKDSLRECVSLEEVQRLKAEGKRVKFICTGEAVEDADGRSKIELGVRKTIVDSSHPFFNVNGCDNVWRFEFDDLCPITLMQHNGTTRDTGYGLLADILDCAGYQEKP